MARFEYPVALSWGLLALRIALGCSMTYHGSEKLMPPHGSFFSHPGAGIAHFSRFVGTLGMPQWLGAVSVCTEFFGGLLILSGLLTRLAAVFITANMFVALFWVDIKHGLSGSEYTFALIAIAVALGLAGAGAFSLDRRLLVPLA